MPFLTGTKKQVKHQFHAGDPKKDEQVFYERGPHGTCQNMCRASALREASTYPCTMRQAQGVGHFGVYSGLKFERDVWRIAMARRLDRGAPSDAKR